MEWIQVQINKKKKRADWKRNFSNGITKATNHGIRDNFPCVWYLKLAYKVLKKSTNRKLSVYKNQFVEPNWFFLLGGCWCCCCFLSLEINWTNFELFRFFPCYLCLSDVKWMTSCCVYFNCGNGACVIGNIVHYLFICFYDMTDCHINRRPS